MTAEVGQNQSLYVANATSPFTFTRIAGQIGLKFNTTPQMIDIASKTSGYLGAKIPGRSDLTIEVSGVIDLPDANGLERVYALIAAAVKVPARFRICKTDVSPIKVRFDASLYVSDWQEGRDDQDKATYSFKLTSDGTAPLADDLTP